LGSPVALATERGVCFAGGRIDALSLCGGEVGRTAEPEEVRFGLAQVRRLCTLGPVRIVHVLFAPIRSRPLLLGLVRLHNSSGHPQAIEYSELWDVPDGKWCTREGACERRTAEGVRALADAGFVVRARVPEVPPTRGLALDVALFLPPRTVREVHFAYAAPDPGDSAALLVRAWRGNVAHELERVSDLWVSRAGASPDAVTIFRRMVGG
jgi:hypothetical protein